MPPHLMFPSEDWLNWMKAARNRWEKETDQMSPASV
jgi:hypothetical protein